MNFQIEQRMASFTGYPKVGFVYFDGGRVSWSYHGGVDLRLGDFPDGAQKIELIESLCKYLQAKKLVTA